MATLEIKRRYRPTEKAKPGKVAKRCPPTPLQRWPVYYVIHVCCVQERVGISDTGMAKQHAHTLL